MEVSSFSVHVLKCPFGVREVHFAAGDAETGEVITGDHYAHVCYSDRSDSADAGQRMSTYAVGGTRGIQQLVATTRGAQAGKPEDAATAAGAAARSSLSPPPAPTPDIFSTHDKGRLLLWDSNTGTLAAAYTINPAFTVHQWAVAGTFLYTTLEGSPATAGAEEETCVYAWDRRTLQPVTVLRGHEGRLTALAVAPRGKGATSSADAASSAPLDVVLATASLDGTVRLWCHRSSGSISNSAAPASLVTPVHTVAVLPTTELGVIKSLRFLTADVLVAACSKCALAFVRLTSAAATTSGAGSGSLSGGAALDANGGLKWQVLRSVVDPDGSTTTLHVSPGFVGDTRKISVMAGASSTTGKPASLVGDPRRRLYVVTGSTSGYLQEWVVEIGDSGGQGTAPASSAAFMDGAAEVSVAAPQVSGAAPPTTAAAGAAGLVLVAAAGVSVRGRWHHKAHSATVDRILTDDDVAVSTSIFDGARLYHRRAGATCVITTTAAVPVLVPQLKQLIWGSVDGTLNVASYALFASGAQKELQPLWAAKPHTAAIRGVCLSLTPALQWRTLCVGAADGSVSLWRPTLPPALAAPAAKLGKAANASFTRVLDVYAAPSPPGAPRAALLVAGLKREGKGCVLATTTMAAEADTMASLVALQAAPSSPADEVTCARLCCGADTTNNTLTLIAGTRGGRLLIFTYDASSDAWRASKASHWGAGKANQRACITAISPLRATATDGQALLAVVAHSAANPSLATQRITVSVLRTHLEKGAVAALVVEETAAFEGNVEVSAPSQGSLVSELSTSNKSSINNTEPRVDVAWLVSEAASSTTQSAAAATTNAAGSATVVVRDGRGLLIRCRAEGPAAWATPEVVINASTAPAGSFAGVTPNLDGALADVVTSDRSDSEIVCVHVVSGRKRVLVKTAARLTEPLGLLCDVATAAVRFAGVMKGGMAGLVAMYDDKGHLQYRVNRDGTCAAAAAAAVGAVARKEANFKPRAATSPRRSSLARSLSVSSAAPVGSTACTVLAASAADRVLLIGYDDGLLQMVDTTDLFVFLRVWVKDEGGVARGIRELHYAHGVVMVRLSSGARRVVAVPPRSILDQPLPL